MPSAKAVRGAKPVSAASWVISACKKHDLLRPVRDFAQTKRQGQVDGITQVLNIFPQGAGGAAAHRVHGTAAAMAGHAVQCIRSIGGVKIIPLLLPCRQVRALPGQQFWMVAEIIVLGPSCGP